MDTKTRFLLLIAIAAVLSASGFILQYGFGVLPCHMCWWQRYAHWAILALSIAGYAASYGKTPQISRLLPIAYCLLSLAALAGLGIALWQFAAQHNWLPFPATCTSTTAQLLSTAADLLATLNNTQIVPCDKENFTLLGLSLAGWNIPAMLTILALSAPSLKIRR